MSVTFTINKTLDGAQRHLHTYLVRQKAKGSHLHSIGIRLLAKWNEIAHELNTLPTAEILNGKNASAWVSMVLYLKK